MRMEVPEYKNWEDMYLNAGCGLLTFSPTGKIIKINNTLKRWVASDSDLVEPTNFLDLLTPGSKLYFNLFVLPILELHHETEEISLSIKSAFGEVSILLNGQLKVDEEGNKIIYASVFRLNNRKKFEKELLMEKNKARNEAMISNQTLHRIAYDHAHQFRAPLANIIGLIDILQQEATISGNIELIGMLKDSALSLDAAAKRIINHSTVYK